jgi:hypothetical protein
MHAVLPRGSRSSVTLPDCRTVTTLRAIALQPPLRPLPRLSWVMRHAGAGLHAARPRAPIVVQVGARHCASAKPRPGRGRTRLARGSLLVRPPGEPDPGTSGWTLEGQTSPTLVHHARRSARPRSGYGRARRPHRVATLPHEPPCRGASSTSAPSRDRPWAERRSVAGVSGLKLAAVFPHVIALDETTHDAIQPGRVDAELGSGLPDGDARLGAHGVKLLLPTDEQVRKALKDVGRYRSRPSRSVKGRSKNTS